MSRSGRSSAIRRWQHPLGLDDGGIDMVTLLIWGMRVSLVVGFAATFVSMVIGGTVGVVAGYFGGHTDNVLMRITDYFLVIPDVPLMIVVAAIWGPSLFHIIIVIGILLWTSTARVIRAQVKSVRERVYVKRARALGAGHARIVLRHVLPQVAPLLVASTVLTIAVAIFDETALAFLGLSDPSTISLGSIMQHAFERAAISTGAWWAIVPPGVRRHAAHPRLQPRRRSAGGRAQPAAAGRTPVGAHLPAASARRSRKGRAVSTPLLQVEDLQVWFDLEGGGELHAVQGVNLSLEPGERLGLVGESGCGKTTTALAIMGLLPSSASVSGRVLLEGDDILAGGEEAMRPHRWVDIAIVFQGAMNALNPVYTVGQQIVEALELHNRAKGATARARTAELLEAVGIPAARAGRYPHELSGGMRQRAAIAMALACNPKVLIADEPTTALDVMVQAQILELLDGLCRDFGLALVLVTHDLPVVAQLCNRCAVMYAGEIVERGPLEAIYHTPGHPYSRMLFAASPDLAGLDEPVLSIPGAPPRLDRPIDGCPFRPRCDSVFDACGVRPRLEQLAEDHDAACHLNSRVPA